MNPLLSAEASIESGDWEELEGRSAEERIEWSRERFGEQLVMSTSFGIQSAVMLHMVNAIIPTIRVIFVDTGYLFPETYRFAENLVKRLGIDLRVYTPRRSAAFQEAVEGRRWEMSLKDLEAYNVENKVEPMNRALVELGASAWLSGLRRTQSTTRKNLQVVQRQKRTVKIHPILDWNEKNIYAYMKAHDLPFHPLWERGYTSVGDWHSSAPLQPGQTDEETRFGGLKRECGLHETSSQQDWQI
jgi:phosphoadenosine phosphosulfate reductase